MLSNSQIRNIIGAEIKNCTDDELSSIREFLTALASIEYETYCLNRDKINAANSIQRQDISPQTKEEAA